MVGTSNTCLGSWQTQNKKNQHSMHDVSDDPLAFMSNKTMGMHLPSMLTPSSYIKMMWITNLLFSVKN